MTLPQAQEMKMPKMFLTVWHAQNIFRGGCMIPRMLLTMCPTEDVP